MLPNNLGESGSSGGSGGSQEHPSISNYQNSGGR